jgi:hypothetical protein
VFALPVEDRALRFGIVDDLGKGGFEDGCPPRITSAAMAPALPGVQAESKPTRRVVLTSD